MIGGKPKNISTPDGKKGGVLGNKDASDTIKEKEQPKRKSRTKKES